MEAEADGRTDERIQKIYTKYKQMEEHKGNFVEIVVSEKCLDRYHLQTGGTIALQIRHRNRLASDILHMRN